MQETKSTGKRTNTSQYIQKADVLDLGVIYIDTHNTNYAPAAKRAC